MDSPAQSCGPVTKICAGQSLDGKPLAESQEAYCVTSRQPYTCFRPNERADYCPVPVGCPSR